MARNIKELQIDLKQYKADNAQIFGTMNRDMFKLKKMNNLGLLEHKLCDRMDDVVKAMTRTMADRFDTAKKFRILENQLKNVFELSLISLRDNDENYEIKQMLNNITKNSKKL